MIYDVKLPVETETYLRQVVEIQMDLLQAAAALQDPFTQQALCEALAAKTSMSRAERLAQWLFTHKEPRETLQIFIKDGACAEKQHLVQKMRTDVVRLYTASAAESLECLFPEEPKKNKKSKTDSDNQTSEPVQGYWQGAKKFLISFYDSLGAGLPASLFTHNPSGLQKYSRKDFFAAFERENGGQYVCAICDEHRHMTILRGEYFSDIEHYFPKSIYPHLACHPFNLIPICKQCNTAHLDRDPLQPKERAQRRTLGEVFLPYRQGGVAELGAVRLSWVKDTKAKPLPMLKMQARTEQDAPSFEAKLGAFAEIYNIPERWEKRIHQIGEQLWRQIFHFVRVETESGAEIDLSRLRVELERLFAYLYEDQGKGPFSYILVWYLANLLVEEIETSIENRAQTNAVLDTIREGIAIGSSDGSTRNVRAKAALDIARRLYTKPALP